MLEKKYVLQKPVYIHFPFPSRLKMHTASAARCRVVLQALQDVQKTCRFEGTRVRGPRAPRQLNNSQVPGGLSLIGLISSAPWAALSGFVFMREDVFMLTHPPLVRGM